MPDANFRASPDYSLLVFDSLSPAEQEAFAALEQDKDFYGLLTPVAGSGLSVKAVDCETALLFYTLQQPGPIPRYVRRRFGADYHQAIATLVLDGVLEMAPSAGDTFVSGARAYDLLYGPPETDEVAEGPIVHLSQEALRYAQALALTSRQALSARLYHYNTIPVSPRWRRRLPNREAVVAYLESQVDGSRRTALARHWKQVDGGMDDNWLTWQRRVPASSGPNRYKLYLSPAPEALPAVWLPIVEALAAGPIVAFKVGATVSGLLRPDKIVAYCTSFEALVEAANHVQAKLDGCPAQGVPFTAGIDPSGLLSWGMDPPADADVFGWQGRESWRLWITNRLAIALLDAKAQQSELPAWRFAIERLRLEGIDTDTWTPRQTMWQENRIS